MLSVCIVVPNQKWLISLDNSVKPTVVVMNAAAVFIALVLGKFIIFDQTNRKMAVTDSRLFDLIKVTTINSY